MARSERKDTPGRYIDLLPTTQEALEKKAQFLSDHLPIVAEVPTNSGPLKIISWNCCKPGTGSGYDLDLEENEQKAETVEEQKMREKRSIEALGRMIEKQEPEVVVLQEMYFDSDKLQKKLSELEWKMEGNVRSARDNEQDPSDRRPITITLYNPAKLKKVTPEKKLAEEKSPLHSYNNGLHQTLFEFKDSTIALSNVWLKHQEVPHEVGIRVLETLSSEQKKYSKDANVCCSIMVGDFNQRINNNVKLDNKVKFLANNVVGSRFRKNLVPCQLISSKIKPNPNNLDTLPMNTPAAYIRSGKQLFYVNKIRGEVFELTLKDMAKFDKKLQIQNPRILSERDLAIVQNLTAHEHLGIQGVDWTDGCLYMTQSSSDPKCQAAEVARLNPNTAERYVPSEPVNISDQQRVELTRFRPTLCCTELERTRLKSWFYELAEKDYVLSGDSKRYIEQEWKDIMNGKFDGLAYVGISTNAFNQYKKPLLVDELFQFPPVEIHDRLKQLDKAISILAEQKGTTRIQEKMIDKIFEKHLDCFEAFKIFRDLENDKPKKIVRYETELKTFTDKKDEVQKLHLQKVTANLPQNQFPFAYSYLLKVAEVLKEQKLEDSVLLEKNPHAVELFLKIIVLSGIKNDRAGLLADSFYNELARLDAELFCSLPLPERTHQKKASEDKQFKEAQDQQFQKDSIERLKLALKAQVDNQIKDLDEKIRNAGVINSSQQRIYAGQKDKLNNFGIAIEGASSIESIERLLDTPKIKEDDLLGDQYRKMFKGIFDQGLARLQKANAVVGVALRAK